MMALFRPVPDDGSACATPCIELPLHWFARWLTCRCHCPLSLPTEAPGIAAPAHTHDGQLHPLQTMFRLGRGRSASPQCAHNVRLPRGGWAAVPCPSWLQSQHQGRVRKGARQQESMSIVSRWLHPNTWRPGSVCDPTCHARLQGQRPQAADCLAVRGQRRRRCCGLARGICRAFFTGCAGARGAGQWAVSDGHRSVCAGWVDPACCVSAGEGHAPWIPPQEHEVAE
jgi:hypothetical protein